MDQELGERFLVWWEKFMVWQLVLVHKFMSCFSLEYFFFLIFRSVSIAYGGSQARGQIWAIALSYATTTATQDPSYVCNLLHSSWKRQILNSVREARDQICVIMDASHISTEPWWEHPPLGIFLYFLFFSHLKNGENKMSSLEVYCYVARRSHICKVFEIYHVLCKCCLDHY